MTTSPLKAFQEYIELGKRESFEELFQKEPEFYDGIIQAFIVNPERFSEHVKLLTDTKYASIFWRGFEKVLKGYPSFVRKYLFKKLNKHFWDDHLKYLEELKNDIKETIIPCEVAIDYLPTRIAETPI